jgi:NACalpha-BTF3-like transcription factor
MTDVTHTNEDLLNDFEITEYEVPVQLELSKFDSIEELELAVVEASAKTIASESSHVDEDDISYITTQVDFNQEEAREAYEDDNVEYAVIVTETQLGLVDD